MNSLDHHATLFDHFSFSNFGYGGDPNLVSRLRVSKNTLVQSLTLCSARIENTWDYSLPGKSAESDNAVCQRTSRFRGHGLYGVHHQLLAS